MTTIEHSTLTMTGAARPAFAARVVRNVVAFCSAWKNRRQIYRLGQMSEWELSDIGLTRADLHVAWQTPFGRDPTTRLGAIVEARAVQDLRAATASAAAERAAREVC